MWRSGRTARHKVQCTFKSAEQTKKSRKLHRPTSQPNFSEASQSVWRLTFDFPPEISVFPSMLLSGLRRNVSKIVLHVQSRSIAFMPFLLPSRSSLLKLPVVVIQKFCHHSNVTLHFSPLIEKRAGTWHVVLSLLNAVEFFWPVRPLAV